MKFTYTKWDHKLAEYITQDIEIPNGYWKKPNRMFPIMNHFHVTDEMVVCVSSFPSIDVWTKEQMMQFGWDFEHTDPSTSEAFNAIHAQALAAAEQVKQIINSRTN